MKIRTDIHVGRATVKAAYRGGWGLPGGEITDDIAVATGAAAEMDQLIGVTAFVEDNRKALSALRHGRNNPVEVNVGGVSRPR